MAAHGARRGMRTTLAGGRPWRLYISDPALPVVHVFLPPSHSSTPPLSPSARSAYLGAPPLLLPLALPPPPLPAVLSGVVSSRLQRLPSSREIGCREMEGKKQPASSSPPASSTSSSSLVADLFGGKNPPKSSSSSFFHSVFPPAATVMGRDSLQSDIFAPSWKPETPNQNWNAQSAAADGTPQGGGNRERHSAYQQEKIDPCPFSSSLYYGGQDICTNTTSSQDPGYKYKKDGEDDSNNPNAASRGNWWQGSLYY